MYLLAFTLRIKPNQILPLMNNTAFPWLAFSTKKQTANNQQGAAEATPLVKSQM